MKSGFEDYAGTHGDRMRIGSVTDSPEKNSALIRSYGTEFVRILNETEWTELTEDLFILIEKGCPKLDIIQLAFACTRGRNLAISDTLASIGLDGPSLDILAQLCEFVSDKIAALGQPRVGRLIPFQNYCQSCLTMKIVCVSWSNCVDCQNYSGSMVVSGSLR